MFFQTAGIEVAVWLPPLVAFCISFFTSMGGVSGAFLLLPFQMTFLGYTSPSVSATNHVFNIVAIPGGVLRYVREGRMVWPLTGLVILGTLPGVFMGALVRVTWLPDPSHFKLFAGAVLLYIGAKMMHDLLRKTSTHGPTAEERFTQLVRSHEKQSQSSAVALPRVKVTHVSLTRLSYEFYGESYDVACLGVLALCFVVGIVGGVYGIGGGAIVAPFFVSILRLPVYTVAGATLMGTFVTSVAGVAFFQILAPWYPEMAVAPDWLLGALFGVGGLGGMYCGARLQKRVPARLIKWMLSVIIMGTALKYVWAFVGG